MKQWEDIRLRCVRDSEPKKRVAREIGISPNTVRRYVRQMEAPKAHERPALIRVATRLPPEYARP